MSEKIPLSPQSLVRRRADITHAEVDGEVIAMSVEKGLFYGLDTIGARIWGLIGEFMPVAELCATLQREYDVAPDVCQRDVLCLLEDLRSEGMIEERQ
jgi:hypothetical protein